MFVKVKQGKPEMNLPKVSLSLKSEFSVSKPLLATLLFLLLRIMRLDESRPNLIHVQFPARVARWILPDSANFNSPYGQLELFTATVNKKSFLALFLRILAVKFSQFLSEI